MSMRTKTVGIFGGVILFGMNTALADGQNADITLIQPSFSTQGIPGISTPINNDFGYLRYGVQSYWVRDPLIYLENNLDQGAVVSRRLLNQIGMEYDFSNRFGVHASLPVALQWASEVPSLSRNGLAVGDLQAGAYGSVYQYKDLRFGAKANILIPTSTNDAWLGETSPRLGLLGNVATRWQDLDLALQMGPHFRSAVNTDLDFVLGNEWIIDAGLKWNIWPNKVALTSSYHARHGLNNLFRGGAENSKEITSGIQWIEGDHTWQLGLATGINDGYGASEFQAFVGYTVHRMPRAPIEEVIPQPTVEEPVVIVEPEIEEEEWKPEEFAKVVADQIIIREDIQFVIGTDQIVEASLPTLQFVAKLINEDVQIGHVVIEGHASEEGTHQYNYDLSNLRARAIFKALAESNVHPDRMSHRGYGEALPKNLGDDEVALAENRRVEFHIIRQDPPETKLELRTLRSAPWAEKIIEFIIPTPVTPKSDTEVYEEEVFETEPETPPENSSVENGSDADTPIVPSPPTDVQEPMNTPNTEGDTP